METSVPIQEDADPSVIYTAFVLVSHKSDAAIKHN